MSAVKCTANWARMVVTEYRLKMFGSGACFESTLSGFERVMKRKHAAVRSPCSVSWVSLFLTPSMYSTDWQYAEMSAFSARILNICSVVTSVQRPCLMMWQTGKREFQIV